MISPLLASSDVDDAAILTSVWNRNRLRREAKLPLLPVRETFERERTQARWQEYLDQHYDRVRAEVLAERRAQHGEGWGLSVGGKWAIHLLTMKSLKASFSGK
jgi:hypothetical protein